MVLVIFMFLKFENIKSNWQKFGLQYFNGHHFNINNYIKAHIIRHPQNNKSLNRQFLENPVSIPVYDFSFPFFFRKSVRQACNTFCINYYDYMAWTMIQTSTKKLHLQKDLFSYDAHNKYSANTTVHPLNIFIISSSYSNEHVIRKRLTKKNNK